MEIQEVDDNDSDEARRKRLWARGWRQAGGMIRGQMCWRTPDGLALMQESDAFERLRLVEISEQDHDE